MGITVSAALHGSRVVHRSGMLRGVTQGETPVYLQEVAALHSLRLVHDSYTAAPQRTRQSLDEVAILAAVPTAVLPQRRWLETGSLALDSAAMPPLTQDFGRIKGWLPIPLRLFPSRPPKGRTPQDLPSVYRAIFMQMEEFRPLIHDMWRGAEYPSPRKKLEP